MHEHKVCEHELKYCSICKVVYCEKCGKQWYEQPAMWYDGNTLRNYNYTIDVSYPANTENIKKHEEALCLKNSQTV